jgi:hypothetical protein
LDSEFFKLLNKLKMINALQVAPPIETPMDKTNYAPGGFHTIVFGSLASPPFTSDEFGGNFVAKWMPKINNSALETDALRPLRIIPKKLKIGSRTADSSKEVDLYGDRIATLNDKKKSEATISTKDIDLLPFLNGVRNGKFAQCRIWLLSNTHVKGGKLGIIASINLISMEIPEDNAAVFEARIKITYSENWELSNAPAGFADWIEALG